MGLAFEDTTNHMPVRAGSSSRDLGEATMPAITKVIMIRHKLTSAWLFILNGAAASAVLIITGFGVAILGHSVQPASAVGLEGDWDKGYQSRARLIAGRGPHDGTMQIIAGVQIEMPPGWKTYWRNPGEAGGVPPEFDWSKSENVKDIRVLFPAPKRLADQMGDSIGYSEKVVFPVIVSPADPSKPVGMALDLFYGVCREICIPAEAKISLKIPTAGTASGLPFALADMLRRVPAAPSDKGELVGDTPTSAPRLVASRFVFDGPKPHAHFDVEFGGDGSQGDLFVEGPTGTYLPMAKKVEASAQGSTSFKLDLAEVDMAELKGTTLRLTLVSPGASHEVVLPIE